MPDSSCSYAGSGATMLLGARLQGTVHTWYSFCGPNGSADYEIRASVTGTRRYRLVVPADAETGFPTYFPAETSEGRLADCELSEDGEELGCTTAGGSTHTWRRS